jgi:predicted transcriptional regulator
MKKTTVEFADPLLRKAKATAASRCQSLKQFLHEAVEDKLAADPVRKSGEPAWMKFAGVLSKAESRRIMRVIKREVDVVDPEDWK